jgi:hypothetical protein
MHTLFCPNGKTLFYKLNSAPATAEKWHLKGCTLKVKHKFLVKVISKPEYPFIYMRS